MLAVDVLLWVLLYTGVVPMPGMMWLMEQGIPMAAPGAMELGVFHVGTVGAVLGYLAMWGVMMWAMMYPAMTRYLREYTAQHRGSVTAVAGVAAVFLLGYQFVWALSGVVPLAFDLALPGGIYGITRADPPLVIGAVLVFTGVYQLTAFKRVRLRACCDAVPPHETGLVRGLRDGLRHGVACVLTCFAPFFLVMPFFGEMNFFWMVALTGVVTLERLPTWGEEITVGTGVVALAAGIAVLVLQPALPVAFVA
jgi:predicted metal-binding membrane protein